MKIDAIPSFKSRHFGSMVTFLTEIVCARIVISVDVENDSIMTRLGTVGLSIEESIICFIDM